MGRLIMAGLGLCGGKDTPHGVFEEAKSADHIMLEGYTSKLSGMDSSGIEKMLGQKIEVLDRNTVESGEYILSAAETGTVLFLTAGDPLVATTHQELRLSALKRGIDVDIIPAPSIYTLAPSLLGLAHYKFGRTTTLQRPYGDYFATSPFEVIADNLGRGLHTLVLLDIDIENGYFMTASEGVKLMLESERRLGTGIFGGNTLVCAVARAGSDNSILACAPANELMKMDLGDPLHTIVVPGKLHFKEAEALVKLAGAPSDIIVYE